MLHAPLTEIRARPPLHVAVRLPGLQAQSLNTERMRAHEHA